MKFEWDINKEIRNIKVHGVDFDQAIEALKDRFGLDDFDDSHSDIFEYRYSRIGLSRNGVLFVIYTVRDVNGNYRIISARKAEKSEENLYWEARYE
jgi:uncharacterized protein